MFIFSGITVLQTLISASHEYYAQLNFTPEANLWRDATFLVWSYHKDLDNHIITQCCLSSSIFPSTVKWDFCSTSRKSKS